MKVLKKAGTVFGITVSCSLMLAIPFAYGATTASATKADRAQSSVIEPVFFATTRKWTGKTFSEERGNDSSHTFGVARFAFSTKNSRWDMKEAFPEIGAIGWSEGPKSNEDKVQSVERLGQATEFFDRLEAAVSKSATGEVVVFVHGYFNDFEDAIGASAQLGSYFKCPVVSYAWPTPKGKAPTPHTYGIAGNNVGWSQQPFSDFLRLLVAKFPGKVALVCHSMGSRLVSNGMLDLHQTGATTPLNEVVFSSADFDTRTFANRIAKSLPLSPMTRFYVSPKDKALKFSRFLYGGYNRVGSPAADIGALTALPKTQVIDFTEYGGGFTGHAVPYWLISNMHKYQRPGGRWTIYQPALQLAPLK